MRASTAERRLHRGGLRAMNCRYVAVLAVLLAALFAGSGPAAAQDVKCRRTMASGVRDVVKAVLTEVRSCHDQRMRGFIESAADCNDPTDIGFPSSLAEKIAEERVSFVASAASACESALTPAVNGYHGCAAPCDASVPAISTYEDVASCLVCSATEAALTAAASAYGASPPIDADKSDLWRCQISRVGKAMPGYLKKRMKYQHKCQKTEDLGKTVGMDCPSDDSKGRIAKALGKMNGRVAKCSDGDLAALASCGQTVVDEQICLAQAAEAASDWLFDEIYPDAGGSGGTAALVINEIVAGAVSGGSDWIELYAIGEGTVSLGDYSLVDDNPDRQAAALPALTLSAGEFFVILASSDPPEDGSDYVPFGLGSDDSVSLILDEATVDVLDWDEGAAPCGASYGRLPDGTGDGATLNPTSGAANESYSGVGCDEGDTVVDSGAELILNEAVAKDAGAGDDWFELYVRGDQAVYLGDYSVVDDSGGRVPVALPAVTLASGEFLVVYATEVAPADGSYFVNFKLGSDDSVSLLIGDDLIDRLEWDRGEALLGFSYGRFVDGSGEPQTLAPTPGYSNVPATRGPLVINEIVASDAGGGSDWFELYNNSGGSLALADYSIVDDDAAHVPAPLPDLSLGPGEYLVINATDVVPGDGSDYVPFKLGASDSLSLSFGGETVDYLDWDGSDAPTGYSYGLYMDASYDEETLSPTPGTANRLAEVFSTDSVEDLYIEIDLAYWQAILADPTAEEEYPAGITYKGVTLEQISFRTKGNSSLGSVANSSSERYSFKVDTNDYVSGQKLLGLKKLSLNNNFLDPTYMRERIAYDLMRFLNVPAPRTAYVNLYINGELYGLYTAVEQVDDEFVEWAFGRGDGDLYKPDGTGSDLLWISADFADYSGVELEENEGVTDNGKFIAMVDELNNGSDYESVIDVDQVLRYLAVSTALTNLDSYQGMLAHNYYLYEQGGRFSVVPWDLNETFGTFRMGCRDQEAIDFLIDEPTSSALSGRPLIEKLLQDGAYRAAYHGYLQALLDGPLAAGTFWQTVSAAADLIRDHVYADPTAFFTPAEFEASLTDDVVDALSPRVVFGLQPFVESRGAVIQDQLDGLAPSSGNGSGSCSGGFGGPGPGPSVVE